MFEFKYSFVKKNIDLLLVVIGLTTISVTY
jgi:hypothetical protein